MASKKRRQSKKIRKKADHGEHEALTLWDELSALKRDNEKLTKTFEDLQARLEDTEIHVNLLTRLLTTLCVEKLGMRVGVLKRLLKRIEKEAIRDSQILHLESLYNLPHHPEKKTSPTKRPKKGDPWEEIS